MCSDPDVKFYPQREIHYAAMERDAANAKWAQLHDARPWHDGTFRNWAEKPSDQHPYHRDHGVTIGVAQSDLRPHDLFLTHERWGPDQLPVAEVVDGEQDDAADPADE